MSGFLVAIIIISAALILAQWFVFLRVRTYLFQHYEPIRRKAAYLALALLGILNIAAARVTLSNSLFGADTFGKKFVEVAFFSYLGLILFLCLFLLIIGLFSTTLRLKDALTEWFRSSAGETASRPLKIPGCKAQPVGTPDQGLTAKDQQLGLGELRSQSRRAFLKWSAASAVVMAASAGGAGVVQAYRAPVIDEFDVLHAELQGLSRPLTFIQISDFHFGMFMGTTELEKLVVKANKLDGDALFITGDIFHSPASPVEMAAPIFRRLKPRRFGNFAILGNHDFYAGERRCVQAIKDGGLTLLRDQWFTLKDGKANIHLGGIDDPRVNWLWGRAFPDFPSFMEKAPLEPGMRILLSHRPSVLPVAAGFGIDLVLSGHIHGGQIILPMPGTDRGISVARLASDFTHGWYRIQDCRMYLNRGTGLTFIPWRINCPPEIAIFHLKPGRGGEARREEKSRERESGETLFGLPPFGKGGTGGILT
jgi:uncharacterized protein